MNIPTVPFFISHQGCPHQCVFCDQVKIAGSAQAIPDEAEILARISAYSRSAGGGQVQVAYFGGTFTALPREVQFRLLQPLQALLASGEVAGVRISTRPDCLDADTASFLRRMGVGVVELGIQSMDDEVLHLSGRGHTAAAVTRAALTLKDAGLMMGAQLMPGLPGDSAEKSLQSLERVIELDPHCLRIYPTIVIKGTPLAELYENRQYEPLAMESAIRLCAAMLHRAWIGNLPVIRMGLQTTADLESKGTILAGPYHPAFRYLVEAELCGQLLSMLLKRVEKGSTVDVFCAPERISTVTGHRRANVISTEQENWVKIRKVSADPDLSTFQLAVAGSGQVLTGHLLYDLHPETLI